MNITPQSSLLPIPTAVNLQTDSLRRENQQREVISKTEPLLPAAAEKGVASDKERARTPAQHNQSLDFASLRKQAELAQDVIGEDSDGNQQNEQDSAQNNRANDSEQDKEQADKTEQQIFVEQQELKSLKRRDQEVRSHELAHAAVGGAHTGAPSYTFTLGPDGNKYAVSGEVSVDLAPVDGDPKATIAKMQKIHAAALAPANPSIQDTRIAASAAKLIAQAQSELSIETLDDPYAKADFVGLIKPNDVFAQQQTESQAQSVAFDTLVEQTLSAQEQVLARRPQAIDARASRIEQFYANINQAYEKPLNYQFKIMA
ncbi:SprA-related family protein [Colwellia chukchiensis]|uniref:SprA-related family protein n=1 Tax=Colwellia chukchiensis TaxID=641665 RepID=A0A1H7Q119_9GAMM|nr:putative metalloprotease CJM1_0395 family protein [Colwellia chukchiensis]SEL41175.1 SprA-related family protein [Colwellia chukchiensis]